MSKINIIDTIKNCIFTIIEEEYKNYLKSNNILLIEDSKLLQIVTEFYTLNVKNIKVRELIITMLKSGLAKTQPRSACLKIDPA